MSGSPPITQYPTSLSTSDHEIASEEKEAVSKEGREEVDGEDSGISNREEEKGGGEVGLVGKRAKVGEMGVGGEDSQTGMDQKEEEDGAIVGKNEEMVETSSEGEGQGEEVPNGTAEDDTRQQDQDSPHDQQGGGPDHPDQEGETVEQQNENVGPTSAPLTSQLSQSSSTTSSSFARNVHTANTSTTPGLDRTSSPLAGTSTGPKKFSAVNINKKFLAKTGKEKESIAAAGGSVGSVKQSILALGRALPASTPSPTLSNLSFKIGKLNATAGVRTGQSPVSGGSTGGTVWAKPTVPTDKDGVALGMGVGEPSKRKGLNGMNKPTPSSMGSGQGLMGGKVKKTWGQLMSEGGASSSSSSMEFPTAKEVVDGQKNALLQAQQIAQARAAHNQAILDGLDAFRGTNRDPNAHYWDEDDDDIAFDQVVDFGDGTTYTIEAPQPILIIPPSMPESSVQVPIQTEDQIPVSKDERFATDDFDRSWPPKASELPPARPERERVVEERSVSPSIRRPNEDATSMGQAARALFNERSNRLEAREALTSATSVSAARPHVLLRPDATKSEGILLGGGKGRVASGSTSFERALPPHLTASSGFRVQDGDLGLGKSQARPSNPPPSTAAPRPGSDWRDRPLPPHMAAPNNQFATPPSGSLRRPSESGSSRPASSFVEARPTPPHVAPAAPAAPPPPPITVVEPIVDLDEMQKGEMHSAAERARLRRQQEEEERNAKAERARQKAKELEDKGKASRSPEVARALVSPIMTRQGTMRATSPEVVPPKVLLQRPHPGPAVTSHQQQGHRQGSRDAEPRPLPPHMMARGAPMEASTVSRSPHSIAPVAAPKAMPTRTVTSEIHPEPPAHPLDNIPPNASRSAARPAVFDSFNWRKASSDFIATVPNPVETAPPQPPITAPPGLERRVAHEEVAQSVPPPLDFVDESDESMTDVYRSGMPKTVPLSGPGSSLDDLMAKIRSAMDKGGQKSLPEDVKREVPAEEVAPIVEEAKTLALESALPDQSAINPTPPEPTIVLPRPQDFGISRPEPPTSPKLAWKTVNAKVPPVGKTITKPARQISTSTSDTPPGWLTTWDPVLTIPATMSRDEWLIGTSYSKGKVVYTVKLPTRRLLPVVKVVEAPEVVVVSDVAATTANGRKIVVKLPPSKKMVAAKLAEANPPTDHGLEMNGRETFAQTSVQIQTSSPISTSSALSVEAPPPPPIPTTLPIQRQRSPRKVSNDNAVTFALPGFVLQPLEPKGSVRFMVSSELEGDNLLEEVNNMSLEGLAENQVEEVEVPVVSSTQSRTPTSPSARSVGATARSGPPSPNAATSAAWNTTNTYPGLTSPARGLPNRDHIKSVWSHPTDEAVQRGNSLIGIVDDFPNMLPNSVQDLRVEADKLASTMTMTGDTLAIEDDSPRYASISMSNQAEQGRSISGAGFGGVPMQQSTSGSTLQSPYLAHNQLTNQLTNPLVQRSYYGGLASAPSSAGSDLAHNGMPMGAISTGFAFGNYAQPQGVWMPISQGGSNQQGGNQQVNSHAGNQAFVNNNNATSDGSYGGKRMPNTNARSGQMINGYGDYNAQQMAAFNTAGGMYSHSTGPLDYNVPRPFAGGLSYPNMSPSSFGPVISPRQYAPTTQSPALQRPRAMMQQMEQSRYGPSLLSEKGPELASRVVGGQARQNHTRGGSGGGIRRGPW